MDTPIPLDERTAAAQREVQRWLGRCLIRLQQYERTVKEMVALHDVEFRSGAIETSLQSRRDMVARRTLGQVVGSLFDTHVVPEGLDDSGDEAVDDVGGGIAIRLKIQLQLPDKDYAAAKKDIADLVQLRNRLIHHFIEQHDLWADAGCESGLADLQAAYDRIDGCFLQLQLWANWLDQSRQGAAALFQTDEFQDAIAVGILPGGTVAWPIAAVVCRLRDEWASLSVDGWAVVGKASDRISSLYPDLMPARHGCTTWRHLLQESRQFEIRYFLIDGKRVAHYRPKPDTGKH